MRAFITASICWILLAGIFGLYGYGLFTAIDLSWKGDIATDAYPDALSTAINSLQALLLTNLGVLLGITVTKPNSTLARTLMPGGFTRPVSAGTGALPAALPAPPNPLTLREQIQLVALVVYIAGLIACTIAWGHDKFTTDTKKIIDVVSTSGKMLIGVAISYLTAILSR